MYWWICGTILWNYKRVILWFDLLARLIDWNCGDLILTWTQNILQFGWGMDWRSLKQNYNESLAMSLLEILFSSHPFFFTFFVFLVCSSFLKVCGGSSSVLWRLKFVELRWFMACWGSRGFWAWFQWTLRSGQIVWKIQLRMFFDFKIEVLESFETWFL